MPRRIQEIVIDCADPRRLARFWSEILGAPLEIMDESWASVIAEPVRLAFQRVPEGKQSPKNRVHVDVEDDDLDGAAAAAVEAGAVRQGDIVEDAYGAFVVMTDIEGNEFCFVTSGFVTSGSVTS
jgi:predicted enzyme related to lactoylglutathione lyase